MLRKFPRKLATVIIISVAATAWSQTNSTGTSGGPAAGAAASGSSAGPGQSGATNNSAGPAQTGATNNSAGPNQTGAAGPPSTGTVGQPNPTPTPAPQSTTGQPGNPSATNQSSSANSAGLQPGQGASPRQNAPSRNQPRNNAQPGATQLQQVPQQFGIIGQTPWFNDPIVRQQLLLQDNQYDQLSRGYVDAWNHSDEGLTQLQNTRNLDDRLGAQAALRGKFRQQFGRDVDTVFTDLTLHTRYIQLYLQYQGYGAFEDVVVQQQLRLTPAQRQEFALLHQQWNEQMLNLSQLYATDRDAARLRYNQLRSQTAGTIHKILTADQRPIWARLTGTPYNFAGDMYFQQEIIPPAVNPPIDNQPVAPDAATLR